MNIVKEMPCIVCPMSCHLSVTLDENGKVLEVTGNSCKRGDEYARAELSNPTRMVTSTVKLTNGLYSRLPVILSKVIPKDRMFDVMAEINKIEVMAPVSLNQVLLSDVCGLGADVLASRTMPALKE